MDWLTIPDLQTIITKGVLTMKLKNGMPLQISKAQKDDAKEIIEYLNIVGGESDNLLFGANDFHMTIEAEENFISGLGATNTSALFIGRIDDEIVCCGSVLAPQRTRIAHLADLAISVKKNYWKLGIGTCLMQTMIEFAKANGQTEILHLGVKEDNIAAINLYKKMGFVEIGRYTHFFKIQGQYWDEILMNLYLN